MKYFEDFQIGEKIKTRARTITETDIVNFSAFSGDWYPLHVDVEYAKKSIFGERIAHGLLVLSATSGLMPLTEWAIVAFYGIDKVRFFMPTKIGDTLRLEIEVKEKGEKNDIGGVVTFHALIKNQRDEDMGFSTIKIFIGKTPGTA
jgi:3-hydroxybutyryl-CoA dehydratase